MGKAIDLTSFFKTHLPFSEYSSFFFRVENATVRSGKMTMDAHCEKSDLEIMRVRNLGAKCFEAAVLMREKDMAEKEKTSAAHFIRDG